MQQCNFEEYPAGTRVQIGARIFERKSHGTFWQEEHELPGNRISRPSASLRSLEVMMEIQHVLLHPRSTKASAQVGQGRIYPVQGNALLSLTQAEAQVLNVLIETIEANSDDEPDWIDGVCAAKEKLPASLRGKLFEMALLPQDLLAVCLRAEGMIRSSHALELLEDYTRDAQNGLLTADRLKGFLQGVCGGGGLLPEDYDDLDRMLLALQQS